MLILIFTLRDKTKFNPKYKHNLKSKTLEQIENYLN